MLLSISNTEFHNALTISDDQSAGSKIEQRILLALKDRTEQNVVSRVVYTFRAADHVVFSADFDFLEMAPHESDLLTGSIVGGEEVTSADAGPSIPTWNVSLTNESTGVDGRLVEANLQNLLDGADGSKTDLKKLQEYIQLLQAKAQRFEAIHKEQIPCRYQVLYRIHQKESVQHKDRIKVEQRLSVPFFDHPEWVKGAENVRRVQCNVPLTNFDLYLEKNKDISFIVYRNFDPDLDITAAKSATGGDEGAHVPKHTSETIRPIAKDLVEAIKSLLESREEYAEFLSQYRSSYELPAPYLFVYHSRKHLEDIHRNLSLSASKQLSLLSNYITKQYGHEYTAADTLLSQNKISQEFVRYLFKPGDVLVSHVDGQYTGYIATSWPNSSSTKNWSGMRTRPLGNGTGRSFDQKQDFRAGRSSGKVPVRVWNIQAWYWDFDGSFQRQNQTLHLEIPADEGDDKTILNPNGNTGMETNDKCKNTELKGRQIAELNVFPIQYASTEVIDTLRRRGKTFWKCRNRRLVSYLDNQKESVQNTVSRTRQADERYMVDLKTYRNLHLENYSNSTLTDELGPEATENDEPPDEQFELLLPLKIRGYNLRRKKWFDLFADRIYDVTWNREAFHNLVIDRKTKDLIQALVSNQIASEKATDLIAGKGNGLIMLLHGGPGTGKTLTAESVAEIAEKPLYRVTCGDVGTKAEDVEKYLESVLHLGKIWGCVVLLDEADVFLEQRSLEDLERNALVSVFLRVLEYYEGILILTSNRVGTFDEAFKSRIQLALHYPTLGEYQRLRIWENFINRLESFGDDSVDIADLRDHLGDLKEEKMNGRQIRNAITTARQYAEWKKTTLTYTHLKDVIEVSGRFDKYLDKLNGGYTQDELAQDEGLRLA